MLKQTDEHPNTFQMNIPRIFRKQEDWIKAVRVSDWHEAYKNNLCIYWEIRALKNVSMHGFEIKVGHIPDGFEQIIPGRDEKFKPEAGKLYYIAVSLQNYPGTEWIQSEFEAE